MELVKGNAVLTLTDEAGGTRSERLTVRDDAAFTWPEWVTAVVGKFTYSIKLERAVPQTFPTD